MSHRENPDSREELLIRYKNIKSLLMAKTKAEKIADPYEKQNPTDKSFSEFREAPSKMSNIVALCNKIQGKIREKSPLLSVREPVYRNTGKTYKLLEKPCVAYKQISEHTVTKTFKLMSKPAISSVYVQLLTKSFKVTNKVYQILEMHEKKAENPSKKQTKDFTVQAASPKDPQNKSLIYPAPTKPHNLSLNSSFIHDSQNYPSNTTSFIDNSFLFISSEPILSYDQFMSSEKALKSNLSYIVQSQKLNRQAQILEFKQKAREKEVLMQQRKRAVCKIQAAFRGWRQRKKFIPIWQRHLRKVKLAKLREISGRIKVLFAPVIIMKALKRWVDLRRIEKERVLEMFKEYSAVFIQKVWRGFYVRKEIGGVLRDKLRTMARLRGLLRGWKLRKVLQTKQIRRLRLGVNDLLTLQHELTQTRQNHALLSQVSNQIPIMKVKLIKEIHRLYSQGAWVKSFQVFTRNSMTESSLTSESFCKSNTGMYNSRDNEPIKPFVTEIDEPEVVEIQKPAKMFKNFLKRGQKKKYDPMAAAKAKKSPEEPAKPALDRPILTKAIKQVEPKVPIEVINAKIANEFEDYEPISPVISINEPEKPKRNFLKRKTNKIKPSKLEWKAKTRIDCWGDSVSPEPKEKKPLKRPSFTSAISFTRVQELENIFSSLSRSHVSVTGHFGTLSRIRTESSIPQFTPYSDFITHFTDDLYQETFEALQAHYLFLCNEE